MNVWKKLTWKNLKLNKKRTIVTIIGIMLSVALVTAVASMFFSARTSLIRYETEKKGNYHYSFFQVPAEETKKLEEHRKIETIFFTNEVGYGKLENSSNENKPYLYVEACDKTAMENLGITLLKGRLPQNENEIVISRHIYTNGNVKLEVGDTISLELGKRVSGGYELNQNNAYNPGDEEEILDTVTKDYTIVGEIARLPYNVEPFTAPGYTCITYLNEDARFDYADVYIRYDKDGLKEHAALTAKILDVDEEAFQIMSDDQAFFRLDGKGQSEITQKVAKAKYLYTCNEYLLALETGIFGDSTLQALASAAMVVVIIILVTSVFCIRNSFDISITEKIQQYGMLSSIGATKRQIRQNVYYEAFLLGICGIPLGMLAGNLAAFILVHVSNYFLRESLNVTLYFDLSWMALFFAFLLGAVTIFLSARKSAVKASKISPIQAIRNSEDIKISPTKIKSPGWVKRCFGIGGEISYKNLKRSKKKYRTTVASITICVTVFIVLYSFVNLAFHVVDKEFERYGYNLSVEYETDGTDHYLEQIRDLGQGDEISSMVRRYVGLEKKPYTKGYQEYLEAAYEPEDRDADARVSLLILSEENYREYLEKLHLNYNEMKEKAVLINLVDVLYYTGDSDEYIETRLEEFEWKAGDQVEGYVHFRNEETEVNDQIPFQTVIGAVTEERPLGAEGSFDEAIFVVGEQYLSYVKDSSYTRYVYLNSSDPDGEEKKIEALFEDSTVRWNVTNFNEQVRVMESFYTLLAIFLYGFLIVIALIGVTSIFNTITTNMNLRKREFAMLKSVGMTEKEFRKMISLESFFYGMRALIVGVPLGTLLSYGVYRVMMSGSFILPYQIPWGGILIAAAAVFLLIHWIMRYSMKKIDAENIIETIRDNLW